MSRARAPGPAGRLKGVLLDGGWTVGDLVERPLGRSRRFSVGYKVRASDGRDGFLKAFDLASAFSFESFSSKLGEEMLGAYNFELELLKECERLSRVVTALADGRVQVEGSDIPVPYLIFELADCDVRHFLHTADRFDLAWKLRTLHHAGVGLTQLHRRDIVHQDLKPSKVLMFGERVSKLGDLGNAVARQQASPLLIGVSGDPDYAAPEWLYDFEQSDRSAALQAQDLYRFGSVILFLFRGTDTTTALLTELDRAHHPIRGGDTFELALPHLQEAYDRVCEDLGQSGDVPELLVIMFRELCQPDPRVRGASAARGQAHSNPYSLERYISKLDLLAKRAEYGFPGRAAA